MQIGFPVEFLVHGTPVSLQAKRAESKDQWKERVRVASAAAIPNPHFATEERLAVTIFYFPDDRMQGDIDNIVKPILDALSRHIYIDDSQVERVVVQKFEPGIAVIINQPTARFAEALGGSRPVLYVKVSNDPLEDLK